MIRRMVCVMLATVILVSLAGAVFASDSMRVRVESDTIYIGDFFSVSFQRTLRVPNDGKTYPLPPGFGNFPIKKVSDYYDRVPASWRRQGGVFIPMYQREAMWLLFSGYSYHPNAVKVAVGKINVVNGRGWNQTLSRNQQDYMVVPPQPWLDGINVGKGYIRQFVAMPLGSGWTIEGQMTGEEIYGGIQIIAFDAKPGRFADRDTYTLDGYRDNKMTSKAPGMMMEGEMGLGAGGKIRQKIYKDPYGVNTWDQNNYGRVYVHIVNSAMYRWITGEYPPESPIDSRSYIQYGLPWYKLYDEGMKGVSPKDKFKNIEPVPDDNYYYDDEVDDGIW